ncbi:hypothetical protein SAMN05216188_13171 [Lentzea xinjiangensis]|uniref:Uncharacterized protein n=1 Tax=Lentzea xinjiangensis TaxID=402600 RepID=A0A1H9W8W6_9PSEU|nr:hypothetical protein [Lentzea xinjiangensis]SES30370.1 hypothetical protein SAMN05216188_13171 [Lentzea xinjiangensis]
MNGAQRRTSKASAVRPDLGRALAGDVRRDHQRGAGGRLDEQVPLRDQRQNRLPTVFHGPYRSG